jgi:hypothetical protein
MAPLRVVLLELLTRLPDLLDHEVVRVPLDNLFHDVVFVARDDDETETLLDNTFVIAACDRELLDTRGVGALTVEWQPPFDVMLLSAFVDALVHGPEDLFVSRSGLRELHSPIIARCVVIVDAHEWRRAPTTSGIDQPLGFRRARKGGGVCGR